MAEDDYELTEDDEHPLDELEQRLEDLETAVSNLDSSIAGIGRAGYGLGTILAIVLSWSTNHAVLWAVLHGLLSWLYVIYYVVVNWNSVKLI